MASYLLRFRVISILVAKMPQGRQLGAENPNFGLSCTKVGGENHPQLPDQGLAQHAVTDHVESLTVV